MQLLLDTHIFFWCVKNDKQLTKKARNMIENANDVYVSSASILEAAIKTKLKKLEVDIDALSLAISESGFSELPITVQHASAVCALPDLHRDPFDRILIAQALTEPLMFLTSDRQLEKYSHLVKLV